jgi:hypothetical protein
MAPHVTARYGFVGLTSTGADFVNNFPGEFNTALDAIDGKVTGWASGVFASRPAAGNIGFTYFATDDTSGGAHGTWYLDNGTTWERFSGPLVPPSGTVAAGGLTVGTARQPNVARPTFVNAQITVGTAGTGGAAGELRIGATATPTTPVGQVQWQTTLSQTTSITGVVPCVVPAGYYYVVAAASTAGTGSVQSASYRELTL